MCFAFVEAAVDVGLGLGVAAAEGERDRVEGFVCSAVAAAVESVADGFA